MISAPGVRRHEGQPELVPMATLPVVLIAGLTGIVLLALSGRYGFFGDELYFVATGHNLSWGYADQPPMLPLIAWLMDTIAPGSLTALRLPAILATSAGVVVSAHIARELGGDRRAQLFTSAAYALSFVMVATTLATPVFDTLLWTVLSWLLVRWIRTYSAGASDDRLLLYAGIVTAVALQVKFQVAVFVLALLLSIAVLGPRDLPRRPMLWAGAAISVVMTIPTLIWQATNGWPQLEMRSAVAAEVGLFGPLANGLAMLAGMGVGVGIVLGFYGWWRLLAAPELRYYRFFGWAAIAVVLFFLVTQGRSYYANGLFPVLWAVGAVGFQRRRELTQAAGQRNHLGWAVWPAFAVSLILPITSLPVWPAASFAGKPYNVANFLYLGQFGWPEMADTVDEVYEALPPAQRETTAILTQDYWAASAMEYYGPDVGLPSAYSGSRGFWYFGHPPERATRVIHLGEPGMAMKENFGNLRQVATANNGLDIETGHQNLPIFLATDLAAPWHEIWPEFRKM